MWYLIRLPDPSIILCKSNINGARLGVFSNPNYSCPNEKICIPFDNLIKVQKSSTEYKDAFWKITINKDQAWVCMHQIHNTRSNSIQFPDASFINYPLPKKNYKSREEYMTTLGQDLRKPNCKIVGGDFPYIVPTTRNGIIPPGHEWIASYGREFKNEKNKREKQITNIKIAGQLKYQNLRSELNGTVTNDVSFPGIWQQSAARTVTLEGHEFTLPKTPTNDDVTSIEIELDDITITRQWRRNHPLQIPSNAMKNSID